MKSRRGQDLTTNCHEDFSPAAHLWSKWQSSPWESGDQNPLWHEIGLSDCVLSIMKDFSKIYSCQMDWCDGKTFDTHLRRPHEMTSVIVSRNIGYFLVFYLSLCRTRLRYIYFSSYWHGERGRSARNYTERRGSKLGDLRRTGCRLGECVRFYMK